MIKIPFQFTIICLLLLAVINPAFGCSWCSGDCTAVFSWITIHETEQSALDYRVVQDLLGHLAEQNYDRPLLFATLDDLSGNLNSEDLVKIFNKAKLTLNSSKIKDWISYQQLSENPAKIEPILPADLTSLENLSEYYAVYIRFVDYNIKTVLSVDERSLLVEPESYFSLEKTGKSRIRVMIINPLDLSVKHIDEFVAEWQSITNYKFEDQFKRTRIYFDWENHIHIPGSLEVLDLMFLGSDDDDSDSLGNTDSIKDLTGSELI